MLIVCDIAILICSKRVLHGFWCGFNGFRGWYGCGGFFCFRTVDL